MRALRYFLFHIDISIYSQNFVQTFNKTSKFNNRIACPHFFLELRTSDSKRKKTLASDKVGTESMNGVE